MDGLPGILSSGGPVILVLLALSVLSLTLIAAGTLRLLPVTGGEARRAGALARWEAGEPAAAQDALGPPRAPADRVLLYAMQALRSGLGGAALDAELQRRGNEEAARMSGGIRILELIATVSPLLGLLGTVLGMIQSFRDLEMAAGSANASVLAGGIWEALLTTAAGLLVAIPAAVGAALLAARVETAVQRIEGAVGRLLLIERGGARAGAA